MMPTIYHTIPAVWKALSAIAAAFVAGTVLVSTVVRAEVTEVKSAVVEVQGRVELIDDRVQRVEDNYQKLLCLQVAELEDQTWQRCLQ